MNPLITLALQSGVPAVEKLLSKRIGEKDGPFASIVIKAIADRVGVPAEDLPKAVEDQPGRVIEAMREVDKAAPDMIATYDRDLQLATLEAEQDEPVWMRAWRPAGMYLLGFLWLWNSVLLHVANAIWKIALPPMPFADLIQLSGLYMALYMGGHTVKDVVKTWVAK